MKLPAKIYHLYIDFGDIGVGSPDCFYTFEELVQGYHDAAALLDEVKCRALQIDFDPDNNMPEHVTDVTEELLERATK